MTLSTAIARRFNAAFPAHAVRKAPRSVRAWLPLIEHAAERGRLSPHHLALVKAHTADTEGNLIYRFTARNFNPPVATAGRVTIAEAEVIVDRGELDPNVIVTPGIFVQRVIQASDRVKEIEQRTVRPKGGN